jgi:FMN phosphatase YigB (HAD superfamily)
MGRFSIIMADAGDVLFSTRERQDPKLAIFKALTNSAGYNYSIDELKSLYQPFKDLSQTRISEPEAVKLFFASLGTIGSFSDYLDQIAQVKPIRNTLFPGVVNTLEYLLSEKIPFVVVSDTTRTGLETRSYLNDMINEQMGSQGSQATLDRDRYITGIVTSRDVGVKKPDEKIFRIAVDSILLGEPFEDTAFMAHESGEILGAAALGINVIAFNIQKEPDEESLATAIAVHNERFNSGKARSVIYSIQDFEEIIQLSKG